MISGDGKALQESERNFKRKSIGSEFGQTIAMVAVAQICHSEGFQGFQQSALKKLADIAVRYILCLGKTSNSYSNLAGRTECNVFDILQGLEDLNFAQGFSCASDVNHCPGNTGVTREIIQHVGEALEIPFVYSIPPFPVIRKREPTLSFLQAGEEPPSKHIPAWLPTFPDPRTYLQTQIQNEKPSDLWLDDIEHAKQHKIAKSESPNLQPQLPCNGLEGEVYSGVLQTRVSENAAAEFQAGENHDSALEGIPPVIEAVKLGPSSADERWNLLNQRPAVQFNIGMDKKSSGADMDRSLQSKGGERVSHWFAKDNEKDDRRRRFDKILKESMEISWDLA